MGYHFEMGKSLLFILLSVSFILGGIFGLLSGKLSGMLSK
jgi:hypothetical protein